MNGRCPVLRAGEPHCSSFLPAFRPDIVWPRLPGVGELKPQTTFPIELIAQPVLRSDASAIVVGPKLVVIELGADGQFVRKLASVSMIEVKAAQATFKLPLGCTSPRR